jgi:hypothetical protein
MGNGIKRYSIFYRYGVPPYPYDRANIKYDNKISWQFWWVARDGNTVCKLYLVELDLVLILELGVNGIAGKNRRV